MGNKFRVLYFVLINLGLSLLIGCLIDTPNGSIGISGKITDANGNAQGGVTVRLLEIPSDSLTSVSWLDPANLNLDTLSVTTDAQGNYSFDNFKVGHYSVLATYVDGGDTLQYFIPRVTVKSDNINQGTGELKNNGTLEIQILKSGRNISNVLCVIPDLHLSSVTNSNGKCFFDVPEGEYEIIYISDVYDINSGKVSVINGESKKVQNYSAEYNVEFISLVLQSSDPNSTTNPNSAVSVAVDKKLAITAIPSNSVSFVRWDVKEGAAIFDDKFDPNTNVTILENSILEAIFRQNVILNSNIVGNGSINPSDSLVIALGNSYNIEAVPDAGWVFEGWSIVSGIANLDSKDNAATKVTLFGNTVLLAKFSLPKLKVDIEISGGGKVEPDTLFVEKGNSRDVEAIADAGQVFSGWTVLEGDIEFASQTSSKTNVTVNGQGKIQARFEAANGSLTIEHEGKGNTLPSGELGVKLGAVQNVSASPDSDWVFKKWIVTSGEAVIADSLNSSTTIIPTSSAIVRAIFVETSVQLSLSILGRGSVSPNSDTTVATDSNVNISAVPDTNWQFVRWVVKSGNALINNISDIQTSVRLNSSSDIQAQFIPSPVTLSVQQVGNGTLSPSSDTILGKNQQIQLSAVPDSGWQFFKWQLIEGEGTITSDTKDTTLASISSDATVRGIFKIQDYRLNIEIQGQGSTNFDSTQIIGGGIKHPIKSIPSQGWGFDKWEIISGNGIFESDSSDSTTLELFSDVSIRAHFTAGFALLTAGVSGDGSHSLNDTQTIQMGEPISATATPANEWSFLNWNVKSGNAEFSDAFNSTTNITIFEDAIIEAIFSKNTTTLDVSILGNGFTIPANTANVEIGSSTNITANPSPGWKFDKWVLLNGNAVINDLNQGRTSVVVNTASSLQAVFIDNRATLTMIVEGSGNTSPFQNIVIEKGIPNDISATPNIGWSFVRWEVIVGSASIDETNNPNTSATITEDVTIKAVFSQADVTLTVLTSEGGSVTPIQQQTVSPGSKVNVIATPNAGAIFSSWSTVGGVTIIEDSSNSNTNVIVNGVATVRANFKYELIMVSSGQGTINPTGIIYDGPGSNVSISASAAQGWFFERWEIDQGTVNIGDSLVANTSVTLNTPATLRAIFKEYPVSLKIEKVGLGTYTPSADTFVSKSQQVPIEAFPSQGWNFNRWEIVSGNAVITDINSSFTYVTMEDNTVIRTVFDNLDTVNIIATPGGGSTTPSGIINPKRGDTLQLQASANTGWQFKYWTRLNGNTSILDSTNSTTSAIINGNDVITAVFSQLATLELRVTGGGGSGSPPGIVSPSGIQVLESGKSISVSATPSSGYQFVQWNLLQGNANIENSQSPSTNITVNDSSIVVAQFRKSAYLFTSKTGPGRVEPATDSTDLGQSLTIIAIPNSNKSFLEWQIESGLADIVDSKSDTTSITLLSDTVRVKGVFVSQESVFNFLK